MNRKGDMLINGLFLMFIISVLTGYLIYNESNVEDFNNVEFINELDANVDSSFEIFAKPVYDGNNDMNYMVNMTIHSFIYLFKNMSVMVLGVGLSTGSSIESGQYNTLCVIIIILMLLGLFIALATPIGILYFVIKDIYNEVKKKYFKKK